MASQNAASTPIFWGTGKADPLVKVQFSEESSKFLIEQIGMPVAKPGEFGGLSYNVYEGMGHATVPKELDELKAFLKKAIPESKWLWDNSKFMLALAWTIIPLFPPSGTGLKAYLVCT